MKQKSLKPSRYAKCPRCLKLKTCHLDGILCQPCARSTSSSPWKLAK